MTELRQPTYGHVTAFYNKSKSLSSEILGAT